MGKIDLRENSTGKGLATIYQQEIIQDVTLFTSQSTAAFYDKLFSSLDFTLPRAAMGRRGFSKEAMVCAFLVIKCKGFSQITYLADYLDNNRLIAHYNGFNIVKPLLSYWAFAVSSKTGQRGIEGNPGVASEKLYELGIVDVSFIGLDSILVAANIRRNNPKSFARNKLKPQNHIKADPDCALGVHSVSNQHDERQYEFSWGYKNHVLVGCISGFSLFELITPANVTEASAVPVALSSANVDLPIESLFQLYGTDSFS